MNANTMSIEDVIKTLDVEYQLSPFLKLRGHISWKAAKLAGIYAAKQAKIIRESEGNCGLDTFNAAMAAVRGFDADDEILTEAGLHSDQYELWETIRGLVMYSNRLTYEMQAIVDPTGKKQENANWKVNGVYFTDKQQIESWRSSIQLVANDKDDPQEFKSYADYVKKVLNDRKQTVKSLAEYIDEVKADGTDWLLSEEKFLEQMKNDSTLYTDHEAVILDLLLSIGSEECYFDELPIRTQIAAIENMRGKINSIVESLGKSISIRFHDKNARVMESTKVKGLVTVGFEQMFCQMLESSRYANYAEYMYNYIPNAMAANAKPITRAMIARNESNQHPVKLSEAQMSKENDDFLNLVSDEV